MVGNGENDRYIEEIGKDKEWESEENGIFELKVRALGNGREIEKAKGRSQKKTKKNR